ncbi:MAG: Hsp20/alpha crystallin family protein, partial [Holophagales bacterium]|nr:Hsp20/alpha crystallin family protein [Holophagales bacterium]
VEDHTLTLSGERRASHEGTTADRVERVYGRFVRRFNLPGDVDVSAVSAEFEHGVLNITIPKAEEAKARKIDIA